MRITTVSRRPVVVLVAATLISAAGTVTGLLSGTARAAAVVATVEPSAGLNAGSPVVVTLTGGNLRTSDRVALVPNFSGREVGAIAGEPVAGQACTALQPCTTLKVAFQLLMAPPGMYDVKVTDDLAVETTCDGCFQVQATGRPSADASSRGVRPDRGDHALDISGSHFARGATVAFLKPDGAVDPHISYKPGFPDPAHDVERTAYPSSSTILGNYTTSFGFQPGRHLIKVTNTDGSSGATSDIYFPFFASSGVVPAQRGAFSTNQLVTVHGGGIREGSELDIADLDPRDECIDVSVGESTVNAQGTAISAPVSLVPLCFTEGSAPGQVSTAPRTVSITGPDGPRRSVVGAFRATPAPTVDLPAAPVLIGQDGRRTITLTGSGFAPGVRFSFGDGVQAQVLPTSAGVDGSRRVDLALTAAPDAAIGPRSITVTNPDGGTTTLGAGSSQPPLQVTPAPTLTTISPEFGVVGSSPTITVEGERFSPSGMTASVNHPSVHAGPVTITQGAPGQPDKASFVAVIDDDADAALSDVRLINTDDGGGVTCVGCFGVLDGVTAFPTPRSASNDPGSQGARTQAITFAGAGLSSSSTVVLQKVNATGDTPDIAGTGTGLNGDGTITRLFDLSHAAVGSYNATVLTGSVPRRCSACFTVTGEAPILHGVTDGQAGQGAADRVLVLNGERFSRGMRVSIPGLTVGSSTFVSPTELHARIGVPETTPPGARDVTVANADGVLSAVAPGALVVTPRPQVTHVFPGTAGQGAVGRRVSITAHDLVTATTTRPGTSLDLGPGIAVQEVTVAQDAVRAGAGLADLLTARITVDPGAALGSRGVRVVNPDGGVATVVGSFAVTPAPRVTAISPALLQPGQQREVTISGSSFFVDRTHPAAPDFPSLFIANVPATITAVNDEGTVMTATLSADGPCPPPPGQRCAAIGTRSVEVFNPDQGRRVTPAAFTVAMPPFAPTNVRRVSAHSGQALVSWEVPTFHHADGGTPVTSFVVDDGDSATDNAMEVGPDQRSTTLTGLELGTSYAFSVTARNAVGASPTAVLLAKHALTPSAPPLTALPGEGTVRLDYQGAEGRGDDISGYDVSVTESATGAQVRSWRMAGTNVTVGGLTNGTEYAFMVRAVNSEGPGPWSSSVTATPRFVTQLTSLRSVQTPTAYAPVIYSGRLTRATTDEPLAGQPVILTLDPDTGPTRTATVTTTSTGAWSLVHTPVHHTNVTARFGGGAADTEASSGYRHAVRAKVVRNSPASGASSARSSIMTVTGKVFPNKAGHRVYLRQGTTVKAQAVVASDGRFSIRSKLPAGRYSLNVLILATPGNSAGATTVFTHRRT